LENNFIISIFFVNITPALVTSKPLNAFQWEIRIWIFKSGFRISQRCSRALAESTRTQKWRTKDELVLRFKFQRKSESSKSIKSKVGFVYESHLGEGLSILAGFLLYWQKPQYSLRTAISVHLIIDIC